MSTTPSVIQSFDAHAEAYDRSLEPILAVKAMLHVLIRCQFSGLPEDARILVAGAGTGAEARFLAPLFPRWQFTLVDPSEAMLAVGRRPFADGDAQYIGKQLAGFVFGEAVVRRQRGDQRDEPGAERAVGYVVGKRRAGDLATARTGQRVQLIFGDGGHNLGQLGDLMAQRGLVLATERMATALAVARHQGVGLVHLLFGYQLAATACVALLPFER